jgi:hypothetical protein
MKKLVALKSIVDFIWIVCCLPLIPLMLVIVIMAFFDQSSLEVWDKITFSNTSGTGIGGMITALIMMVIITFCLYAFFIFRKTLRLFLKRKPFDPRVIQNFARIGKILLWVGIAGLFSSFLGTLIFESKLMIGGAMWGYLFLSASGLFFQVLSEIFKIAKQATEENQLTI